RAARAAPRGQRGGRIEDRWSPPRHEPEAVRDVADLPPERRDLLAEVVAGGEIAPRSDVPPPFGELDDLRGRHRDLGQRGEAEEVERRRDELEPTVALPAMPARPS